MHVLIERRNCPLFGDKRKAEKIVSWSQVKDPGTRLMTKRGIGLSLELIAQGSTPQIYLYFNLEKFKNKLSELGPHKSFTCVMDGISISLSKGTVRLCLLTLPKKLSQIWEGSLSQVEPYDILVGMVEFGEDAFRFYTRKECPARPEMVEALAVVGRGHQRRPVKRLSDQSKRYLLKDALLNVLLQKETGEVGVENDG